jgi:hypothetical protein
MPNATIAQPNAVAGDFAAYAGWNGSDYSWECWNEGRDSMGILRPWACASGYGHGDLDHATLAAAEHMADVHGLVRA